MEVPARSRTFAAAENGDCRAFGSGWLERKNNGFRATIIRNYNYIWLVS
jgi:hypothetical protein